jgi:phage shock protein A
MGHEEDLAKEIAEIILDGQKRVADLEKAVAQLVQHLDVLNKEVDELKGGKYEQE